MEMTTNTLGQITDAYKTMAREADYRRAAPLDEPDYIAADLPTLDLEEEARQYAGFWWKQEESQEYVIGCPHSQNRQAMIYAVEAAGAMCAGADGLAIDLLKLALEAMRQNGARVA
jgi:hypothetical protein